MTTASGNTNKDTNRNRKLAVDRAGATGEPSRRRRYTRQPISGPVALTAARERLLLAVADYKFVSLPQLVRLINLPAKTVRREMRVLFDTELVDVVAIPRAVLAETGEPNVPGLVFGSAPNLYTLTPAGAKWLRAQGLRDAAAPAGQYGPKNYLFLRHELAVRDVRVYLERCARRHVVAIHQWRDAAEAICDLRRERPPKVVRPDAWFTLAFSAPGSKQRTLVGLVELDRGTERGGRRWQEKLDAYGLLFAGDRLPQITGHQAARVLVVAPTVRRCEELAAFIHRQASPALAERFWLAPKAILDAPDLTGLVWHRPGSSTLRPLLSTEMVGPAVLSPEE